MAKFTISLDKIIDEFKLETIYTPKMLLKLKLMRQMSPVRACS